jgi:uncharacterized protein YukE
MPQAIVNPDDMVRFASDLGLSAEMIRQHCGATAAEFERLSDLWRDDKYQQFSDRFEEFVGRLRTFCNEADEYAGFLRHKAALAEQYLRP